MRYLVTIPVFNEASTIQAVLQQVRPYAQDILVIDDGSTDPTHRLLADERNIKTIRHRVNRGYGRSLSEAFTFAIRQGYDWLVTMDCDGQHEPSRIPDLLRAATEDHADIVSGSRYLREMPSHTPPPADRRAINQKITDLLNELLDLQITDAFCGFKAYRVAALEKLHITVPGYGMPLQLWVQAAQQGLSIREIPVPVSYTHLTLPTN